MLRSSSSLHIQKYFEPARTRADVRSRVRGPPALRKTDPKCKRIVGNLPGTRQFFAKQQHFATNVEIEHPYRISGRQTSNRRQFRRRTARREIDRRTLNEYGIVASIIRPNSVVFKRKLNALAYVFANAFDRIRALVVNERLHAEPVAVGIVGEDVDGVARRVVLTTDAMH